MPQPKFPDEYAQWLDEILRIPSVSPYDHGAQPWLISWAEKNHIPFEVRHHPNGATSNMALTLGPKSGHPHWHFVGHTDVVPADTDRWFCPPFQLTCSGGKLYGRGICDMKGALVACLAAYKRLHEKNPQATITLLLTSDEEGDGAGGIQHLLKEYPKERVSRVLIGEPTAEKYPGDCVKIARRGSLHGHLLLKGACHHVAYPQHRDPLTFLPQLLSHWKEQDWDNGAPGNGNPTQFQITQLRTEDCVENVIPGKLSVRFNFRYSSASTALQLQQRFTATLPAEFPLEYMMHWRAGARPWQSLLTAKDVAQIFSQAGYPMPILSSGGGVSDGYKVSELLSRNIMELGLPNKTAHQHNEHVSEKDFLDLVDLYAALLATQ